MQSLAKLREEVSSCSRSKQFHSRGRGRSVRTARSTPNESHDVVINGTSVCRSGEHPPPVCEPSKMCDACSWDCQIAALPRQCSVSASEPSSTLNTAIADDATTALAESVNDDGYEVALPMPDLPSRRTKKPIRARSARVQVLPPQPDIRYLNRPKEQMASQVISSLCETSPELAKHKKISCLCADFTEGENGSCRDKNVGLGSSNSCRIGRSFKGAGAAPGVGEMPVSVLPSQAADISQAEISRTLLLGAAIQHNCVDECSSGRRRSPEGRSPKALARSNGSMQSRSAGWTTTSCQPLAGERRLDRRRDHRVPFNDKTSLWRGGRGTVMAGQGVHDAGGEAGQGMDATRGSLSRTWQ